MRKFSFIFTTKPISQHFFFAVAQTGLLIGGKKGQGGGVLN